MSSAAAGVSSFHGPAGAALMDDVESASAGAAGSDLKEQTPLLASGEEAKCSGGAASSAGGAAPRDALLDLLRAVMILCIATEHGPGGAVYSERNVFHVSLWVLYFTVALSSFLFAKTRSVWWTNARLLAIFAAGVLCNTAGKWLSGTDLSLVMQDWRAAADLVFQMFYVLGLLFLNLNAQLCKAVATQLNVAGVVLVSVCIYAYCALAASSGLLGLSLVDGMRAASWLVMLILMHRVLEGGEGRGPEHQAVYLKGLLLAFFASWLLPCELYGWEGNAAKSMHCLAAWVFGYMWAHAQNVFKLDNFSSWIDSYWPMFLVLLLVSCVPGRVDMQAPQDDLLRLGVLLAWSCFFAVFARLTVPGQRRPDYLGLATYLTHWTVVTYISHKLLVALTRPYPAAYHYVLWNTFALAIFSGVLEKRGGIPAPAQPESSSYGSA